MRLLILIAVLWGSWNALEYAANTDQFCAGFAVGYATVQNHKGYQLLPIKHYKSVCSYEQHKFFFPSWVEGMKAGEARALRQH